MHVICHIYISMLKLQESHPNIYKYLKIGGFTASVSGLLFSKIPYDQITETTINWSCKGTHGLSEKTENIGTSEKWICLNHIIAALREHLDSVIWKKATSKHIDYGKKKVFKSWRGCYNAIRNVNKLRWASILYSRN